MSDPVAAGPQAAPEVTLRLFAAAREAAGTGRAVVRGRTVAEVIAGACATYGSHFGAVVARSRCWVNGEEAAPGTALRSGDEVAVLPPVSGGSGSGRFSVFAPGAPEGVAAGTIRA